MSHLPPVIPKCFAAARRAMMPRPDDIDGAVEPLSARRGLYWRTICAPGHQAILEPRFLAELSNQHHSGNGQRQDDDQPDKSAGPALVGSVIALLGSVIHAACGSRSSEKFGPDLSPGDS